MKKQLVFIGYGAMAKSVHQRLPTTLELAAVVVTERSWAQTRAQLPDRVQVVISVDQLALDTAPDLVLEMAGQEGLKRHGVSVLQRGWPLAVISVGALADEALAQSLRQAARQQGTQVRILPGAVAGMDGLGAARIMGLDEVRYQGRKPPQGWRGSAAEKRVDLDSVAAPTVFFQGSAREAALLFPANANVAATIGLAGVGLDHTRVELIADPHIDSNQHQIMARGAFGRLEISVQGVVLPDNPKTSTLAALSVVRACLQLEDCLVI